MKYYLYISTTKINMLHEQIQDKVSFSKKISQKINLKFYSLVNEKSYNIKENIYPKLNEIINHLNRNDLIGSIENPKSYFKGEIYCKWGIMSKEFDKDGIVYFAGETNNSIIILCGSVPNLIGHSKGDFRYGGSDIPNFFRILRDNLLPIETTDIILDSFDLYDMSKIKDFLLERSHCPKERVEFIARKLMYIITPTDYNKTLDDWEKEFFSKYGYDFDKKAFILGTPLYVSYID